MPALLEPTPEGFLRGGVPHRIVSGAVHYFRIHPDQWRDRLRRVVALGCDTVETYVAWNIHQAAPGETTFEGIADLGRFLDIAAEEGLDAIVRPGPYICAEWENGGYPGWVTGAATTRRAGAPQLRASDPEHLALVDAWFDELIPVIAQRQASRGGNVVMVQVENEYGSFGDDAAYLAHLRDGLRERGIDELLVTSDGPARMWLTGGTVEGALATVNFGSRTEDVLEMAREELPAQPLMCMEFWNGWFDHWGEEHHARDAASAVHELTVMLESGMSVNFYMAHGGTNFGLTAGANNPAGVLEPTTTSYDYDAPIAEDGTLTEKFRAFREVIAAHRELPPLEEHLAQLGLVAEPAHLPAGPVAVTGVVPLRPTSRFTRPAPVHAGPPTFEELGLERGLLRLSRELEMVRWGRAEDGSPQLAPLQLHSLHDRAWVFVDGLPVGVLSDGADPAELDLTPFAEQILGGAEHRTVRVEILVENLGRANFGPHLGQRKGILGGIWQGVRFHGGWEADPWPLEEMGEELAEIAAGGAGAGASGAAAAGAATSAAGADAGSSPSGAAGIDPVLPALVTASFTADAPADTFLDVSAAGHGAAYVNGFCVGRYWGIGPQQALYVPAPIVRAGENEVLLLELEKVPASLALATAPIWATTGTPQDTPAAAPAP